MENITEYDIRQLRLMRENLILFENKELELSSLIGNLEFLLNALEFVNEEWEDKFLKEITTLETISALEIIKDAGEDISGIKKNKKDLLIFSSIQNLNNLINSKLDGDLKKRT